MLNHLSTRTRQFISALLDGKTAKLGGTAHGPLSDSAKSLLNLFAENLDELRDLKGADLIASVDRLAGSVAPSATDTEGGASEASQAGSWKIGVVRVQSFRGIAPAREQWDFDFEVSSHLLYGPNGCGKSSLLGAMCWCLTSRLFRDDCPPSQAEAIQVFSTDKKPKADGTRPDALSLVGPDGTTCPSTDPYWVEIQFISTTDSTKTFWLRRHSHDGLFSSTDAQSWQAISGLQETELSELDVELRVLMPARVGHIRFGKDNGVLGVFSQIVGLDDLEMIADVAARSHTAMVKEANSIAKNQLTPGEQQLDRTLTAIKESASDPVTTWESYKDVISAERTLPVISKLKEEIASRSKQLKGQLASDLGIELPEAGSKDEKGSLQQLDNLPGHIDTASTQLALPSAQLFPTSLGLPAGTTEEVNRVREALVLFQESARPKAKERLTWALKERESAKAGLMLLAAAHFPPGSKDCPVCEQALGSKPDVLQELEGLQELAEQPHLRQSLVDLERALISDLDKIVSASQRQQSRTNLGQRVLADWNSLKGSRFLGLVRPIADKFDAAVTAISDSIPKRSTPSSTSIADGFLTAFPEAFTKLDAELETAQLALSLKSDLAEHHAAISAQVESTLRQGDNALATILNRGQETNRQIKSLATLAAHVASLQKSQAELDAHKAAIKTLNDRAAAASSIKDLGVAVRQETIDAVRSVEPVMKAFYERLYDSEHLVMDMVTTGHAANPNIKDEFNIYLRAGGNRLPAGPFANAGRLRAIALCFAFALQQKSPGTLRVVILDDPALSLDDEHKARFVDHLVTPLLKEDQVIMATHYENFFKCAEPCFTKAVRLQMAPRRSAEDALAFEPADLLHRVEVELQKASTRWREMGINLRRWAERALGTLSGYCPIPFAIFNNIPDSVKAYAAISDSQVATDRRTAIVDALQSPAFERIKHRLAHDEDPTETEVRDGLKVLQDCRKAVEAEIERFRGLFKHALLKRGIAGRPVVAVLGLKSQLPAIELEISGRAAAATGGVGITWTWEEPETLIVTDHQIGLVKSDVIAPIASTGNYIILDVEGRVPNDGDLVAVRTEGGKSYVRRLWQHEALLNLEATNPTTPIAPVVLPTLDCEARRIVGVLFDGPACSPTGVGNEWVSPGSLQASRFDGVLGIRVDGTSLEPIARDGQVVLVRKVESLEEVVYGQLACIDMEERGAVLKRCYKIGDEWILCPVNPVDVEIPIRVAEGEILHAYRIVGVLFEPIVREATSSEAGE